jgi:pimeloyl-ACP methyl ester carboxylesterase
MKKRHRELTEGEQLSYQSTSRFVAAGSVRVHYNEAGNGQPLVMIHGAGPGATSWSNFHGNLPELARQFRVIMLDQPGFGESDKPEFKEPYFSYQARVVRDVLDALRIGKASFVGNSLGGGVALRLAIDFPDRVDRLVLMGPGGANMGLFSPEPSEGMKLLWDFYAPPGPSRAKLEAFIRIMVFDQSLIDDDLIAERYAAATDPAIMEGQKRVFEAMRSREFREQFELWRDVHKVKQPALLIWGRDDRTVPLDGAFVALKRMRNAQLHVFSRCAHWCQVEHAEAFNRLVADFITH